MDAYIVRQPIINKAQHVEAYEIVYQQDSSTLYNQNDTTAATAIISFFNQIDRHSFLEGKDAFLTFTPNLLMQNVPKIFDEKKLVIQIEDNVLVNPHAIAILKQYKERGYRMALNGFDFYNRHLDILPDMEYLKVDFSHPTRDQDSIKNIVSIAKRLKKKTIAYHVNSPDARGRAVVYGFDYIQGESVAEMMKTKVHRPEKLHSTFFRLMAAITRPQPDFDEIEQLVSLDVTLTFSLLKMVNSAYFALPNRIREVKQALTILGLGQLKQWIYLMSFVPDSGMAEELIKTSFLRAVFCQKLSQAIPSFPIASESAYLLGMFSTLDVLLEVPLADAVSQLPLADEIKNGLLGEEGPCQELLALCVAYEKGRWTKVAHCAENLRVPVHTIAATYFGSVEYVNGIWSTLLGAQNSGK